MDKMVCEVRSITKRFQKRGPAVFAPVSFSLYAGEILGIAAVIFWSSSLFWSAEGI